MSLRSSPKFREESIKIEGVGAIFRLVNLLVWFGQVAKQGGIFFFYFLFFI